MRAELANDIEEGIRSSKKDKDILVTPAFWNEFEAKCHRRHAEIEAVSREGKIGNLLTPKELYEFVSERIASGDCKAPTEVVCAATPYIRAERTRHSY